MIISFLLTTLPGALLVVGGLTAAISALHIAITLPAPRRPSDKATADAALGLALIGVR